MILNVGGRLFFFNEDTMGRIPTTCRLYKILHKEEEKVLFDPDGNIFIDRNGETFAFIFEYLSNLRLNSDDLDEGVKKQILLEFKKYGISYDENPQNWSLSKDSIDSELKF